MIVTIEPRSLPTGALLQRYFGAGNYTDCLTAVVPGAVPIAAFVTAFFTSSAFRPERVLLAVLFNKPSPAADLARLASGEGERFAAWTVEARAANQLLLCDFQGATRTWLMTCDDPAIDGTRLCFGSAVVLSHQTGRAKAVGRALFWALLWFHKAYARMLLRSAVRQLNSCS